MTARHVCAAGLLSVVGFGLIAFGVLGLHLPVTDRAAAFRETDDELAKIEARTAVLAAYADSLRDDHLHRTQPFVWATNSRGGTR